MTKILSKPGANDRSHSVTIALKRGIIGLDTPKSRTATTDFERFRSRLRLAYDRIGGIFTATFFDLCQWVARCGSSPATILAAALLVRFGINELPATSYFSGMNPQMISACAGILLLAGLWTPVVGALIAVMELWAALTHAGDPWIPIVLATLGATSAMIGPGARSMDARLCGGKHIFT